METPVCHQRDVLDIFKLDWIFKGRALPCNCSVLSVKCPTIPGGIHIIFGPPSVLPRPKLRLPAFPIMIIYLWKIGGMDFMGREPCVEGKEEEKIILVQVSVRAEVTYERKHFYRLGVMHWNKKVWNRNKQMLVVIDWKRKASTISISLSVCYNPSEYLYSKAIYRVVIVVTNTMMIYDYIVWLW